MEPNSHHHYTIIKRNLKSTLTSMSCLYDLTDSFESFQTSDGGISKSSLNMYSSSSWVYESIKVEYKFIIKMILLWFT